MSYWESERGGGRGCGSDRAVFFPVISHFSNISWKGEVSVWPANSVLNPSDKIIINHCLIWLYVIHYPFSNEENSAWWQKIETEVINSSQVGVFTGKYLVCFNSKAKKLFLVSCCSTDWTLLLLFLVKKKKLLVAFSLTSQKPPIQWKESCRKACMVGSKRPNQRERTTWLPQRSTYPKSESVAVWAAALGPKTWTKIHFIGFTNPLMWSHCRRTWMETLNQKKAHRPGLTCDVAPPNR